MKILAVEFSSDERSVALVEGGKLRSFVTEREERERRPAGTANPIFSMIETLLNSCGIEREWVECIAVGLGPGSYAGVRAAIALAQGWQLARGVRAQGVSSAEAMARRAHSHGVRGEGNVLIDAQRGEFYRAHCEFRAEGPVLGPLELMGPEAAGALRGSPIVPSRELAKQFPGAILLPPDAASIGRIAAAREEFVPADKLEPIYLRVPSFVKAPPPRVIPPIPS